MEDDISFKYMKKWRYKISEIMQRAPRNWTVIKLHTSNEHGLRILNQCYEEFVPWNRAFYSGCFYLMNRIGLEKVLNNYFL